MACFNVRDTDRYTCFRMATIRFQYLNDLLDTRRAALNTLRYMASSHHITVR